MVVLNPKEMADVLLQSEKRVTGYGGAHRELVVAQRNLQENALAAHPGSKSPFKSFKTFGGGLQQAKFELEALGYKKPRAASCVLEFWSHAVRSSEGVLIGFLTQEWDKNVAPTRRLPKPELKVIFDPASMALGGIVTARAKIVNPDTSREELVSCLPDLLSITGLYFAEHVEGEHPEMFLEP